MGLPGKTGLAATRVTSDTPISRGLKWRNPEKACQPLHNVTSDTPISRGLKLKAAMKAEEDVSSYIGYPDQ